MSNDLRKVVEKMRIILKEVKRRFDNNALKRYNVGEIIHHKQMEFHKCKLRNRWVFGGNRSGKTECGAVEVVWFARGIHPYRQNRANCSGWVVSVSFNVQREVAQHKILHYLSPEWIDKIVMEEGAKGSPECGIIDTIYVKNIFGGISKIGFKSADQSREKFQGASLDYVWFDEEPPFDIYEECRMRVLDKKGDLFGTMTPLKGLTWVYDEIYLNKYQNKEIVYFQMEWADNPFLDKDEINELTLAMSDESVDARRFGRFRVNEGLVYTEFDPATHIIEPFDVPKEWQAMISIDPGLNNPLSCHFYCVDNDDNIFVIAEHYEKGRDIEYHSEVIRNLASSLDWYYTSNGKLETLIDSASTQRTLSGMKTVSELFYECGIVCNSKVNKEIFVGIAKVKEVLAKKKIFIFNTCVNLIRELKTYWWGKGDNPIKRDDHALDELRYFIMSHYKNKIDNKENKSVQMRYKEKLLKNLKRQQFENR